MQEENTSHVKAALLGVEHPHSAAHLRTLQVLPEIESIFLWDESQSALTALREAQGDKVEATYTDLDALLARDDLFFVITALRNDLGPAICERILAAGKHIMAEKPIGRNAAEAEQVVLAAERAGLQLGVCYQNRWHPVIQEARRLVGQGLFGTIMSIEVRLLTTQPKFRNPSGWLFSQEQAGGGILAWLGCHYIDMIRFVTRDEIVSVAAEIATRSGENIDVEDVASLAFRFRSGAIGSLHAAYVLALSGGGYHNPTGYDTYFGIYGRAGRIYWYSTGVPANLQVESAQAEWAGAPKREFSYTLKDSPAYGRAYGEQFIHDFIRAAQGEGSLPASGRDALQVARVVDAAYESSRTGRRIDVKLPSGGPG
jgi:predicted dehydrogenase